MMQEQIIYSIYDVNTLHNLCDLIGTLNIFKSSSLSTFEVWYNDNNYLWFSEVLQKIFNLNILLIK